MKSDALKCWLPLYSYPISQCGDGCSANLKAAHTVDKGIGLNSSFTGCRSHKTYGTIKKLRISKTFCNENAKALYETLRTLLKHFSINNKSSELLINVLTAMEMNNIHNLDWGSTRMARFLDAFVQASKILVPLLDTIITMKIYPAETAFNGSAKGGFFFASTFYWS